MVRRDPYFIAIERIVSADAGTPQALLVLARYALVYCLPCMLLLGAANGDRVRRRLRLITGTHRGGGP